MTKIGAKEIDGKMNNTEMKVVGFAEEKRKKNRKKRSLEAQAVADSSKQHLGRFSYLGSGKRKASHKKIHSGEWKEISGRLLKVVWKSKD